jgi:cell cycle sensor histidine kinase DivJ
LRAQLASLEEQQHQLAAAKSGFLASASHELRTPLNAILGFSDILLLGVAGELASDKHREYVTLIRESGAHLLSVVNTILDMSKLESGHYSVHREEIELPAVVAMCEAMVAKPAADKAVTIAVDIADDVQVIDTDRRAFRQILINLLSNAVKFSHRAGKVSVTVRREGADNVLRVADCGIGMGQEFIDKVGTPFLQAQTEHTRQYEGTGLGLSVVKGLVGVLSGTLLIESGQGTGTTVTIRLPVDEQSTRPDKVIRFQERTGERNDKTIRKSA